MTSRRLQEQRVDNHSSNDDLKRSINTLPTSSPQNPAPNPFVVGRTPTRSGGNDNQSNNRNGSTNSKD
jgi:hypothetical protein